jgi:hypothetical protein
MLGHPAPDDDDPIKLSGLVGGGDYEEVYGFYGTVPNLHKDLWKIDNQ